MQRDGAGDVPLAPVSASASVSASVTLARLPATNGPRDPLAPGAEGVEVPMETATPAMAVSESVRVFVVDDHEIVREGLHRLTEQEAGLTFCGEADSAAAALRRIPQCAPNVVIVDLALDHASGLAFVKDLKTRWPRIRILVFTVHDEAIYAERCLRAGATGYVMKSEPASRVVDGIRAVHLGQLYLSDAQSTRLLRKLASGVPAGEGLPTDVLTDREIEVLEFVGRGLRTRDIAANLHLSVKTVEWHRAQIKRKLRLRDANDLLRYAFHWVSRQGMP